MNDKGVDDKMYDVKVIVKSQKGICDAGHQVGDEFMFVGNKCPAGLCMDAMTSIAPIYLTLHYGGIMPFFGDEDVAYAACPDGNNPVNFELRRIRK